MKKTFTACLLIGLLYTSYTTQASESPTMLENNMTDRIIAWEKSFIKRFKKEGVTQVFGGDYGRSETIEEASHLRGIATIGAQFATPLTAKMISDRALYRFELNGLAIFDSIESLQKDKTFYLIKGGFSGRRILSPKLIAGGYLFHDQFFWLPQSVSTTWTTNLGLEAMWPQYGTAVTVDTVCNPFNLFGNADDRYYKASIKCSILKPNVFDLFTGISITKPLGLPREYLCPFGIKFRIPTNKWNINKRFMFALGGTYTPQEDLSWKSFGGFVYIQINLLKANTQNSLRDYLRMPIDRLFATPWHPDQHYRHYTPSSTPLTRSGILPPPKQDISTPHNKEESKEANIKKPQISMIKSDDSDSDQEFPDHLKSPGYFTPPRAKEKNKDDNYEPRFQNYIQSDDEREEEKATEGGNKEANSSIQKEPL